MIRWVFFVHRPPAMLGTSEGVLTTDAWLHGRSSHQDMYHEKQRGAASRIARVYGWITTRDRICMLRLLRLTHVVILFHVSVTAFELNTLSTCQLVH